MYRNEDDDFTLGEEACMETECESSLRHERHLREYQRRFDSIQVGVWEAKSGPVRIADMTVSHIQNTISLLRRYGVAPCSGLQKAFVSYAIPILQTELTRKLATFFKKD